MGDILTDSEIDAVLAAVRGRMHGNGKRYRSAVRDELILRLMLFGGLRVSEVVSLRPCDVSIAPVNGYLNVRHSARNREIPIARELAADLLTAFRDDPRLLQLTPAAVRDLIAEYCRRAGLVRTVSPKALRCTFACWAYGKTIHNPTALARHLGVETPEAAVKYLVVDVVGETAPARFTNPGGHHGE